MGTSSLRAVILAAAVALGIFGLAKAFPENASKSLTSPSGTTPRTTPSQSPSSTPKTLPPTRHKRKPKTRGVTVQVLNGSGTPLLALQTTESITNMDLGFKLLTPGNATRTNVTTIFYKSGFKASATYLASKVFPDAALKLTTSSTFTASLTVVLGSDFAATATPTPSAS
ncbi:MAG TPA: LytR C-terminal domain-containing protein [Actinomycetota bacterium]